MVQGLGWFVGTWIPNGSLDGLDPVQRVMPGTAEEFLQSRVLFEDCFGGKHIVNIYIYIYVICMYVYIYIYTYIYIYSFIYILTYAQNILHTIYFIGLRWNRWPLDPLVHRNIIIFIICPIATAICSSFTQLKEKHGIINQTWTFQQALRYKPNRN